MELTLFLAKLLGIIFLISSLSIVVNRYRFIEWVGDIRHNHLSVLLFSWQSIILGTLIVLLHNVWIAHWAVLITLTGWLSIFIGTVVAVTPAWGLDALKKLFTPSTLHLMALIGFVIGILLFMGGFGYLAL